VHARSLESRFLLQIGLMRTLDMRREASGVSFLLCPYCVRGLVPGATTHPLDAGRRTLVRRRSTPTAPLLDDASGRVASSAGLSEG
jgi:hypothetical protein